MVSLALQHNVPVEAITRQLCGIRCMSTIGKKGCNVLSCPDAIGRALKARLTETVSAPTANACPECGAALEQAEGCIICHNCGYSKCG